MGLKLRVLLCFSNYHMRLVAHGELQAGGVGKPGDRFAWVSFDVAAAQRLEGVPRSAYTGPYRRRGMLLRRRHTLVVGGRAGNILIGRYGPVR